jgi:GAF domain-containing protein/HAMP domain-containing protein
MSLRWRLIILVVALPLLVLVPLFVYVGAVNRASYREARLSKGEMINRQVERLVVDLDPYVTSLSDASGLKRYLRDSVGDEDDVAFAALVFDSGYVVHHSLPGMEELVVEGLRDLEEGVLRRDVPPYGDVFLVVEEVDLPPSQNRTLYTVVGQTAQALQFPLLNLLPFFVSAVLAVVLIVLLQRFLNRMVLQPLVELSEGAARVGAGDLDYEVQVDSSVEFSVVSQAFNEMAERLRSTIASLETEVEERTSSLSARNRQLEAVARVSREATTIRDVNLLLTRAVEAISEQFGFYQVGLFLVDDADEWAVLRAASSEGGQRMLSAGHRLRIGRQGIVGVVAATRQPRIALDVGEDAVWFDNPYLPETRSELGLPLVGVEGRVIGVLDVQSAEAEAFTVEDIEVLQLLADQLSVALQNAESLEQTQAALAELETLQSDYSRAGWARVVNRVRPQAYEYDRIAVQPVLPMAFEGGTVGDGGNGDEHLMVEPMEYGDSTVGLVALSDSQREWTEDERELVRSVSEQVAIALENARLFEDAQRTAKQQALLNLVLQTAAMTTDPDEALRQIAGILAQGLGMAVGVFTFPRPGEPEVRLQSFVTPQGEDVVPAGSRYPISRDLSIFLRGITEPELGKMLSTGEVLSLSQEEYDLDKVLYVSIRTASAQAGFMTLVQRKDDILLDPETRSLARNLASQVAVVLENMNLLEETQRRASELAELYEAGVELSSILDVQELLNRAADLGREMFNADVVRALYRNPEAGKYVNGESALNPELLPSVVAGPVREGGMTDTMYETRKGLLISDNREAPFGSAKTWADQGILSLMGAPLLLGQEVLGVIYVTASQPGEYDEGDLRLLEFLATQVAGSLQNALLYAESLERASELAELYEAGVELNSILDVKELLDRAAELGREMFEADVVRALYLNPEEGVYINGESAVSPELLPSAVAGRPSKGGMTDTMYQTRRGLLIYDNRAAEFRSATTWANMGILSLLGAPMLFGQDVLGVIYVTAMEAGRYDDHDLQMLEFLATQVAGALQNALLYGETTQRAQNLRQLYEAGLDIASLVDLDIILYMGAEWARRLLDAHTTHIFYWDEEAQEYQAARASVSAEWLASGFDDTPRQRGMTYLIRTEGEGLLIDDMRDDPRVKPELVEAGMLSQVAVPLRLGPDVIGAIFVYGDEPGDFVAEDMQLLNFLGTQIASSIQNALMFGQTQETLGVVESQALYQTSVAQATALLADQGTEALGEVLELLGQAAEVAHAYYFSTRMDGLEATWELAVTWEGDPTGGQLPEGRRLPPASLPDWQAALEQEGLVLADREGAEPEVRAFLEDVGAESVLALSVPGSHILPGFLAFFDPAGEEPWGREEIASLRTVAAALSSTLARERLLEEVRLALSDSEILYEAGAALNVAQSYDQILNVMRTYTVLGQGAHHATIQIFNRPWAEGDLPEWGMVTARYSELERGDWPQRYPFSAFPQVEDLMSEERVTLVRDVEEDPRLGEELRSFLMSLEAHAALFVPLLVAGQFIGFMSSFYREELDFSEDEVRRLANLSAQAAVAIQNQYQLQAAAARARRERLIREIVGQIQTAPDVQGVLQTATRELGRALRTQRTFVHLGGVDGSEDSPGGTGMLRGRGARIDTDFLARRRKKLDTDELGKRAEASEAEEE